MDNRPGQAGSLGAAELARASADGHTVGGGTISSHAINVSLYGKLPYDPVRDFTPVSLATTSPLLIVVPASLPAKDLSEFIAHARAAPGKLNYGSSGPGSLPHLATELFMSRTGTQMAHISYKGIGPSITALLANEVQFSLVPIAVGMPHVKSGKLRALAVTTPRRWSELPDVPTLAEAGVPGYEAGNWWGIAVPASTPQPIIDRLSREIMAVLKTDEVKDQFAKDGAEIVQMSPAQSSRFFLAELEKWGKVVKEANIKAE